MFRLIVGIAAAIYVIKELILPWFDDGERFMLPTRPRLSRADRKHLRYRAKLGY